MVHRPRPLDQHDFKVRNNARSTRDSTLALLENQRERNLELESFINDQS